LTDITPPQYLEPIIAATWDEDGAVSDVCRALQPRFREPNAIVRARALRAPRLLTPVQVVFKALIVLHTMMRSGSTDNVLSYLSSHEVLHLRNVSAGQWEGAAFRARPPSPHSHARAQATTRRRTCSTTRSTSTRASAHTAT
jgi:hypothetical protein